jgi:hypothetical protein
MQAPAGHARGRTSLFYLFSDGHKATPTDYYYYTRRPVRNMSKNGMSAITAHTYKAAQISALRRFTEP